MNVYDWLCLPMPLAMRLYNNGIVDLSRFPCHQLNGSFNALSALRKTVQWANQGVFDEAECDAPIAFVVFRRTKATAMRRWVAGGPGSSEVGELLYALATRTCQTRFLVRSNNENGFSQVSKQQTEGKATKDSNPRSPKNDEPHWVQGVRSVLQYQPL